MLKASPAHLYVNLCLSSENTLRQCARGWNGETNLWHRRQLLNLSLTFYQYYTVCLKNTSPHLLQFY